MTRNFSIALLVLAVIAGIAWVLGVLGAVVIPLFGGVRAEKLGFAILLFAGLAEGALYFFGWLSRRG